jgi:hypothetical protein
MSKTPSIIGNLFVQIIKLAFQAVLIVVLIIAKVLSGILQILISWIENSLGSEKH